MAERKEAQESETPPLEAAYYLFAAASELFSGSVTGQGAFIASMCKINNVDPLVLRDELLHNNNKLKGLQGMAKRSHAKSRMDIAPVTIQNVRGSVNASFEAANEMIFLPADKLSEIKSNYFSYIRPPHIPASNLANLTIRETNYRNFARKIIDDYSSGNEGRR